MKCLDPRTFLSLGPCPAFALPSHLFACGFHNYSWTLKRPKVLSHPKYESMMGISHSLPSPTSQSISPILCLLPPPCPELKEWLKFPSQAASSLAWTGGALFNPLTPLQAAGSWRAWRTWCLWEGPSSPHWFSEQSNALREGVWPGPLAVYI
jgi:hypothetical protein